MGRRGDARRDATGDDTGAAAVEFALVALPLFVLLFGIIQYGLLMAQTMAASSVAHDGARWAATGVLDCDAWQADMLRRAGNEGLSDSLNPEADMTVDVTEGVATASVTFVPLQVVPLVPIPAGVTRTATVDLENLPASGKTSC